MTAESGTIAILFGLLAAVLLGSAGFAIDYTRMVRAQRLAQSTIDAATLAAVQQPGMPEATEAFAAYIQSQAHDEGGVVLNAKIDSFDGVTLKSSADVEVPMTLSSVLGISEKTLKVQATAQHGQGYQEIYFALDLSGSLGVGATAADRAALEALTQPYVGSFYGTRLPQGCAFGCHRREGWEPDNKTVYEMAREAGIQLREDELIHQFAGLVDLLLDPSDPKVANGMRKVSVMAFSQWAQQLAAPSSSASEVKATLNGFPTSDRYATQFANAFQELQRLIGQQGNGTSAKPLKTVVLITDGIESRDAYFSQRAIDQQLCTTIKDQGFRLSVIELKYPKLESNALYDDTVLPVEGTITPGLEACASPGWHFVATFNEDIPSKFNELKDRVLAASSRLTK